MAEEESQDVIAVKSEVHDRLLRFDQDLGVMTCEVCEAEVEFDFGEDAEAMPDLLHQQNCRLAKILNGWGMPTKFVECRRCSECQGREHHWFEDVPTGYSCKHCGAEGEECGHCDAGLDELGERCGTCKGVAVVLVDE